VPPQQHVAPEPKQQDAEVEDSYRPKMATLRSQLIYVKRVELMLDEGRDIGKPTEPDQKRRPNSHS
jgi:hypothetical protein